MNWPSSWFNVALAKEPLNWLVVGVVATIWLIAFHVIMTGFNTMQSNGSGSAAPGQGVAPAVPASNSFNPTPLYSDQSESRFVGDGWLGNS